VTLAELKAEMERQRLELIDREWELEVTLQVHEDPGDDPTEAVEERSRIAAKADAEVLRLLNTLPFGDRATRRLDYLLTLAHSLLGVWHRRRLLSLCRRELEEIE
jgi:hypothetical protein